MHPRSLSDIQTASAHPAPIPERVDYLEKLLGDSANKHWKEIQAPKAAHAECDAAHRSMSKDLEGLKGLHEHNATVAEHLQYLEQTLSDSADKRARELSGVRASHAHHVTLSERLGYLKTLLGDSADKHERELEALKATHAKQAQDLGRHGKEAQAHHASMGERTSYLEKGPIDSADRHATSCGFTDFMNALSGRRYFVLPSATTPTSRHGSSRRTGTRTRVRKGRQEGNCGEFPHHHHQEHWLQLVVCIDVFLCGQAQNMAGKMVGIWFPISAFVGIGFEHIPATMFMMPLGLLAGADASVLEMLYKNFPLPRLAKLAGKAKSAQRGKKIAENFSSPPSRALAATGWLA